MKRIIDVTTWNRKEHFEFFRNFEEPFFGIVAEVDCTAAYKKSKEICESFFLYYLHKSISAANQIEEFRYRLEGDVLVCYDTINPSSTIGRPDGTFGYSFIEFRRDFKDFVEIAEIEIKAVQNSKGLRLNYNGMRTDVIHYSSIPWIKFTGLTHARSFRMNDSVPKISFGKLYEVDNKKMMPIAVNVHHGLADGLHVGKYFELFQELLNS